MGGEKPFWGGLSGSPIGVSRGPTSRSAGGGGEGEVVAVVTGRRRRRAPAATMAAALALLDSGGMARRTRGPRWAQGHRRGPVEAEVWLAVTKGRGWWRRGGGSTTRTRTWTWTTWATFQGHGQSHGAKESKKFGRVQCQSLSSKTAGFKSAEAQPDKWGVQRFWGDVAQRVGGDGGEGGGLPADLHRQAVHGQMYCDSSMERYGEMG